jgi:erythronate-4-phosphate dehydrogenase
MLKKLNILIDQNIPLVEEFFSDFGNLLRKPGRQITAVDCREIDILLVRSVTKVNKTLLEGSSVKFVGSCTIGIDHLDVDYLTEKDIAWANAPGCNANAVIQYVLSAMAAVKPDWMEKTVGIIGCGAIGGKLHQQLSRLGVSCLCYDPFLGSEANADLTSLEDVLSSDVITLHTPLTLNGPYPTFHLLNAKNLSFIQSDALLINSCRGSVIDNNALLKEIDRRSLSVVLDVWEDEPGINQELLQKTSIGTPHIAGYSLEGKERGTYFIYRALCQFLKASIAEAKQELLSKQQSLLSEVVNMLDDKTSRAAFNEIILTCYNIRQDDQALRDFFKNSYANIGPYFDGLRNSYAVRREFNHFLLPESLLHTEAGQWFDRLKAVEDD